jgi:hypothetical protein
MTIPPELPQNIPEDARFLCDKAAVFDMAMKRNTLYVGIIRNNTGTPAIA